MTRNQRSWCWALIWTLCFTLNQTDLPSTRLHTCSYSIIILRTSSSINSIQIWQSNETTMRICTQELPYSLINLQNVSKPILNLNKPTLYFWNQIRHELIQTTFWLPVPNSKLWRYNQIFQTKRGKSSISNEMKGITLKIKTKSLFAV